MSLALHAIALLLVGIAAFQLGMRWQLRRQRRTLRAQHVARGWKVERCDPLDDYELTSPEGERFFGSCTVWHDTTTGRRCPSSVEAQLADIVRFHKRQKRLRKAKR